MISPKLPSLNSILADKKASDNAPVYPALQPTAATRETPTDTAATATESAPKPAYEIAPLAAEPLHTWLTDGKLYALIDGLNQPELAGQIRQRHPEVETALYQGTFGAQHTAETPRFSQMDVALYDWLQPNIEQNTGWGWALLPCKTEDQALTPEQQLAQLRAHYAPWSWAATPQGETWLFRLQDPRVLQKWLSCAPDDAIAQFLAPLQHLILLGPTGAQTITSQVEPLHQSLPLAPWPETTVQTLHTVGKEQLLARLHTHVQTHHAERLPQDDAACRHWLIRQANRAYRQGLQDEQSICKYLSLSAVLGADFDQGDSGAWARTILQNTDIQGSTQRIDQLVAAARERLSTSL
ncbi:MAG: DUF4123 domain-containing protein [Pseudomonadota bacterium]